MKLGEKSTPTRIYNLGSRKKSEAHIRLEGKLHKKITHEISFDDAFKWKKIRITDKFPIFS